MNTKMIRPFAAICVGLVCLIAMVFSSCNKLGGLPIQQNPSFNGAILTPTINMNVWQFIKSRAIAGDSLFYDMYSMIMYSGIDTNEYILDSGRTYILYQNAAVYSTSPTTGKTSSNCFYGHYKVSVNGKLVAATSISQYTPLQIKNHLLSLIVKGEHSFNNIPLSPSFQLDTTLAPNNYDSINNPHSLMTFCLSDPRYTYIMLNDFPNSLYKPSTKTIGLQVTTGGIVATNGPMHVVNKVLYFLHK